MDFFLLVRLCSFFFTKLIFVRYGVDDGGLVFTQEMITKYTTVDGLSYLPVNRNVLGNKWQLQADRTCQHIIKGLFLESSSSMK